MEKVAAFVSFIGLFLLLNHVSYGQLQEDSVKLIFHRGCWELNFSAGIGNLTAKSSSSSSNTYGSSSNENSVFYLQLGIIPAYYFTDGLSVEPEINLLIQKEKDKDSEPAAMSFLLNLAYTFNIPNKNFAPYLRAGYGISNSLQFPTVLGDLTRISDDFDVRIINAGVGLKVLLSTSVLFRAEINYRNHNYSRESASYGYSYSSDYTLTSISGLFGFSVLL